MQRLFFSEPPDDQASAALLPLRVVVGAALVLHGWPKIQNPLGWMGTDAAVPGVFQAVAALAEFGGGVALVLGLFTRLAAVGIAAVMIGALALVHLRRGDPFVGKHGEPSWELAAVYLASAALFVLIGPGRFSLDAAALGRFRKADPRAAQPGLRPRLEGRVSPQRA